MDQREVQRVVRFFVTEKGGESKGDEVEVEESGDVKMVEKLHRKYFVSQYKPLMDDYLYLEEDEDGEVEIVMENKREDYEKFEGIMMKLYRSRLQSTLNSILSTKISLKTHTKAFNHLSSTLSPHLSQKSLLLHSFKKLKANSKTCKSILRGSKILSHLLSHSHKQTFLKSLYKWRLSTCTSLSTQTISEISTVIGETKRRKIDYSAYFSNR